MVTTGLLCLALQELLLPRQSLKLVGCRKSLKAWSGEKL